MGHGRVRGHLSMVVFVVSLCVVLCTAPHAPGRLGWRQRRSLPVGLLRSHEPGTRRAPGLGCERRFPVLGESGCRSVMARSWAVRRGCSACVGPFFPGPVRGVYPARSLVSQRLADPGH